MRILSQCLNHYKIKKVSLVLFSSLLIMSGCGKKGKSEDIKETTEVTATQNDAVSEEQMTLTTETGSSVISMSKPYKRGRAYGNRYINDYFGFSCEFGEDWVLFTDEKIDEINEFQPGSAIDENVAAVLETSHLLDMEAVTQDERSVVTVIAQSTGGYEVSEKEFTESGVDTSADILRQQGYTDVSSEIIEDKFCGRTREMINLVATRDGETIYERQFALVNGRYVAILTFRTKSEEDMENTIALFK